MPIFMDRHDVPGLTAMDVAEGHKQDLKIQHKYNCRALTYWFDEKRHIAFCLIEAPRKEAVEKLHHESHGLMPNRIIEVKSGLVEAFLGRMNDPAMSDDRDLFQFIDPAFRVIMVADLNKTTFVKSKPTDVSTGEFLNIQKEFIRKIIPAHGGRQVEHNSDGMMASFVSVSEAVECAVRIKRYFKEARGKNSNKVMQVAIGLSAGNPVTDNEELFGETVQFAKKLCYISRGDQITASSTLKVHDQEEKLQFLSGQNSIKLLSPEEEKFLISVMDITERLWNRADLSVTDFAGEMGLSKSQLYRKLIALTGQSPNVFIREFRLDRAAKLIESQQGNISEIAYETGFSNPSYFSKCFHQKFEISPSAFEKALVG